MGTVALFKKVGILEGVSFLLLLGVAMPLKYMMDMPMAVKYTGWAHGVLFVAYMILLFLAADAKKWGFKMIALGFVAALIPFGPFIFHKKMDAQD